jgi:hypothetical protein
MGPRYLRGLKFSQTIFKTPLCYSLDNVANYSSINIKLENMEDVNFPQDG